MLVGSKGLMVWSLLATIKGNRCCHSMKRYSKSLARVIAEAGTGEGD
jgi:hypothetical protein